MPFCDQRGNELRLSLTVHPLTLLPENEAAALLAAVNEWDRQRREHLDALCVILRDTGSASAEEAWRRRVEGLRSGLRQFSDTVRNVSGLSEEAVRFIQSNVAADEPFVSAVAAAVVAAGARDYIVGYLDIVRAETRRLEVAWDALLAQHAAFQQQQTAVIAQLDTLIRDSMAQARDLDARMATAIADSLSKTKDALQRLPEGGANTANIPVNTELTIAGTVVDTIRALSAGVEDQRARFERYMREETGSVLFLFQDFRNDTQRFIDEFGYRTVLEREEAAGRALAEIVSSGGTSSGNRADAEAFAEAARILVRGHVNNARNTWDDFVQKHQEKFFGPVRPTFARALLDRDLFESKYRDLQANDLHELAERWRNNARTVWGVDLSGIPAPVAEAYTSELRTELRKLDELLRDPVLKRFGDGMRIVLDNAWSMIR